ncbi:hypothetical protein ACJIZ3_003714 [Penstemon smallii]|uniref:MULE transposase domain-containing protein n=1 Tax=Penstemon smallii TaxID=265156 RepID=A0ABD3UBK6_9LAMI
MHSEQQDESDENSVDGDYTQEGNESSDDDALYELNIDRDIEENLDDVIDEAMDENIDENRDEVRDEAMGENRDEVRGENRDKVRDENRDEVRGKKGAKNRGMNIQEDSESDNDSNDHAILSSEDEMDWRCNSEDEDNESHPRFNPANIFQPAFTLGQIFSTKKMFKDAVHSRAINTMRSLKIPTNDKKRIYPKCVAEGCEWHIHCTKIKDENTWIVNEYQPEHNCGMDPHCKNLTSKWLSKRYEKTFRTDPTRGVKGFGLECIRELKVHISKTQAYRRSTVILKQLEECDSNGKRKFDRLYVGFKALRDGFLAGCRPFIGIDGTHLKGPYDGILITAVSVDPNNCLYPIAYAVVWSETKSAWEWFLELLKEDLMIERDDCYTFMSDKQKGLIPAFGKVFPGSDNKFCVRHMIGNMKEAKFKGDEYENALWAVARATTMPDFQKKNG